MIWVLLACSSERVVAHGGGEVFARFVPDEPRYETVEWTMPSAELPEQPEDWLDQDVACGEAIAVEWQEELRGWDRVEHGPSEHGFELFAREPDACGHISVSLTFGADARCEADVTFAQGAEWWDLHADPRETDHPAVDVTDVDPSDLTQGSLTLRAEARSGGSDGLLTLEWDLPEAADETVAYPYTR